MSDYPQTRNVSDFTRDELDAVVGNADFTADEQEQCRQEIERRRLAQHARITNEAAAAFPASGVKTVLSLPVRELRVGDVVTAHGLKCLVDTEPVRSRSHDVAHDAHGGVWYVPALVLNRLQVPRDEVPYSFTRVSTVRPDGTRRADDEHRWVLQGNDLARFHVERAS